MDCLAVLAGNPADLRVDHNGMPAVLSGGDPFKGRTILHGSNASVLGVVTHTDVDGAAAAHDADLLDGYGQAIENLQATLEATKGAAEKPSLSGALKENAGKVKSQPVKDAPAKNGQER